jgi:hypothetical protein
MAEWKEIVQHLRLQRKCLMKKHIIYSTFIQNLVVESWTDSDTAWIYFILIVLALEWTKSKQHRWCRFGVNFADIAAKVNLTDKWKEI